MALTFEDTEVINRSDWFVGKIFPPQMQFTPEQEAKLSELKSLIQEVGDLTFDQEVDVLIAAMTEIRDRE